MSAATGGSRAGSWRRWLPWLTPLPASVILVAQAAPWWPAQICCHWTLHAAAMLFPLLILSARRPAVSLPLLCLMALACWTWFAAGLESRAATPSSRAFTVTTANIANWNANRLAAAGAATATEPALLCLVEVGRDNETRLRQDPRWPYQEWALSPLGIALLSAYPMVERHVHREFGDPLIEAIVDVDGRRMRVLAVHPESPMSPTRQAGRGRELDLIARLVNADAMPVLVLGDFNLSVADPAWRSFHQASRLMRPPGHEPATWPSWFGPYGIGIDHLIGRGLAIAAPSAFWVPGSDHRGLTTRVALAEDLTGSD